MVFIWVVMNLLNVVWFLIVGLIFVWIFLWVVVLVWVCFCVLVLMYRMFWMRGINEWIFVWIVFLYIWKIEMMIIGYLERILKDCMFFKRGWFCCWGLVFRFVIVVIGDFGCGDWKFVCELLGVEGVLGCELELVEVLLSCFLIIFFICLKRFWIKVRNCWIFGCRILCWWCIIFDVILIYKVVFFLLLVWMSCIIKFMIFLVYGLNGLVGVGLVGNLCSIFSI